MHEVIKIVIDAGGYSLPDVLEKIEREWVLGRLADEERDRLIDAARANATADGSLPPLAERVAALELRVKALEAAQGRPEPKPTPEEWPEFARPTGAHDAYPTGAKVAYRGKRYVSLIDGNVWPPNEYPQGWQEQQ